MYLIVFKLSLQILIRVGMLKKLREQEVTMTECAAVWSLFVPFYNFLSASLILFRVHTVSRCTGDREPDLFATSF